MTEAPEKWAKIASKRTFPQLRPLEFAVSSRGGFLLSVSSSQHIFVSTPCGDPDPFMRFQGLRDKNKNLYEKVQMCETWKAGKAGRIPMGDGPPYQTTFAFGDG